MPCTRPSSKASVELIEQTTSNKSRMRRVKIRRRLTLEAKKHWAKSKHYKLTQHPPSLFVLEFGIEVTGMVEHIGSPLRRAAHS
jgi:hypothetical protein